MALEQTPVDLRNRQAPYLNSESSDTWHRASVVIGLTLFAIPWTSFLGGDPWLRLVAVSAMYGMAATSAGVLGATLTGRQVPVVLTRVHAVVVAFAVIALVPFYGLLSPAPMGLVLVSVLFANDRDRVVATGVPLILTVGYAALSGAQSLGFLSDVGVMATGTNASLSLFMVCITAMLCLVAWFSVRAIGAKGDAHARTAREQFRRATQAEAQVAEIRAELAMVTMEGDRAPGPYTGAVSGRYVLGDRIGIGSMSEVYAASAVDDATEAAVKVLRADPYASMVSSGRFAREAQLAARLTSPHVIRVLQISRIEEGPQTLAFELLRGSDLATLLKRRQDLGLDELDRFVHDVSAGLTTAHAAGVIHRDIKPSNLFRAIEPDGSVVWKILDFGIAAETDDVGDRTQPRVVGTPDYMAPEQMLGNGVDQRVDVWALGATLYRVLTGRPVPVGDSTASRLYDVTLGRPYRPRDLIPGLSANVEGVLAIALHPIANDRFPSVAELASAWACARQGSPTPAMLARVNAVTRTHPWRRLMD